MNAGEHSLQRFSHRAPVPTDLELSKGTYKSRKKALKKRLRAIQIALMHRDERAVIVFEGWDAAGKGGVIKRFTRILDPRAYRVWSVEAPNAIEQQHHYLERFWTRLPPNGRMAIFDRSWYGRVLVERVEGLVEEDVWRRAYGEIRSFERMLVDDGVRLVKLWLEVSPDLQRERFRRRLQRPLKQWKLDPDDFRNLHLRREYELAADEMILETSTELAPWTVIPCHDKRYGRIAAMETIADRLGHALDTRPPRLDPELKRVAEQELGVETASPEEDDWPAP